MNRIYEKLKDNEYFKDKMKFDEARNRLVITFHDYLYLEYYEGNYTSILDEGIVKFYGDDGQLGQHWHIEDDETLLKLLLDLPEEDVVYIKNTNANLFTWMPLRIMKKEKFEKTKAKFIKNKSLRIYTVNSIIKRNE